MNLAAIRSSLLGTGVLAVAVFGVALTFPISHVAAQKAEPKGAEPKATKYQEAEACAKCHSAPSKRDLESANFVLLTEYAIWRTHDKHAQAYAALVGPRGQEMGKVLGKDVLDPKTGCMNCHAMSAAFGEKTPAQLKADPKNVPDGVSCGGCHGPSKDWIAPHDNAKKPAEWREKSPEYKASLGFIDLRDPEKRAALCMSCHIGNAPEGKIVTHAMFAAGHPPLPPIEIATFSRNEPQHWRDSKDVPLFQNASETLKKNYHLEDLGFQQTKLALIGSAVALRETMKMVVDRASADTKDGAKYWPELLTGDAPPDHAALPGLAQDRWAEIALAHSDCYACHHDLQSVSFRQKRGFGYQLAGRPAIATAPGRPIVRGWPLGLLEASAVFAGQKEMLGSLENGLKELAAACNAKPFGKSADVAKAAQGLVDWSNGLIAALRAAPYNKETVGVLVRSLCSQYQSAGKPGATLPDYETARQVASVIVIAVEEMLGKQKPSGELAASLGELTEMLDLQPYIKRDARLALVLQIVEKAARRGGPDEKISKGLKDFSAYLKNIGDAKLLEGLMDNDFLLNFERRVNNADFTAALIDPGTAKLLQNYSDEELRKELKSMNDYEPANFLALLRKLSAALPAGGR